MGNVVLPLGQIARGLCVSTQLHTGQRLRMRRAIYLFPLLSRYSDSLRAGRSGDRIPVGCEIFHTRPDRPLGPTQPPVQWVTGLSFGVKRPGRGADHPPPSKCRGQERVGLYLYSSSGPSWPVMGAPLLLPTCLRGMARKTSVVLLRSEKVMGLYHNRPFLP